MGPFRGSYRLSNIVTLFWETQYKTEVTKRQKTKATIHKNTIKHKFGKEPADFSSFSPPTVGDLVDEVAVVTVIGPGRRAEVGMLINLRSLLNANLENFFD